MPAIERFCNNRIHLFSGDCLILLNQLPENSIDAIVTDPPYGLNFMNKVWDRGVPPKQIWQAVHCVCKPGAHLLSFGGTRTYHRMACAVEDAGFEIRDQIQWLFGQGFPKGKAQLKPASEPIVLARKALDGTIEQTHLRWGTGYFQIDDCRIEIDPSIDAPRLGGKGPWSTDKMAKNVYEGGYAGIRTGSSELGRWPANVVHDGSDEVLQYFPESKGQLATSRSDATVKTNHIYGKMRHDLKPQEPRGDTGSAARFFYCAKASKTERAGSKHPTIKPLALMRWLVRLIAPPNGLVLDPFAGTGTTGEAAFLEGRRALLCELDPLSQADIRVRLSQCSPSS